MSLDRKHYSKILETYTKNKTLLSPEKEFHFFLRAHKATGDSCYLETLVTCIKESKLPRLKKELASTTHPSFVKKTFSQKNSINAERNRRRQVFYQKHPSLALIHKLTNSLFFFKKLSLEETFSELYVPGINHLKKSLLSISPLMTKEGVLIDSSYGANTLFHLRFLGVTDVVDEYLNQVKKLFIEGLYVSPEALDDPDLYSAFYTLTHIIIAASNFYRQVPREDFSWIFAYFEKHQSVALERLSLDIQSEIALCYKIMNLQDQFLSSYQAYFSHLANHFLLDTQTSLEYLEKKEHTASIALLLFSPSPHFFPDPDLSKRIS